MNKMLNPLEVHLNEWTDKTSMDSKFQSMIPKWNILDSKGNRKDSIIHCFLKRTILNLAAGIPEYLTENNGLRYECVYDNFFLPDNLTFTMVIISYQAHTYGNFAIIRNYTPIPKIGEKKNETNR